VLAESLFQTLRAATGNKQDEKVKLSQAEQINVVRQQRVYMV